MKNAILLAVACAVAFISATPAKADGTPPGDPKMITRTGAAGGCGSIPITLAPFTFEVDSLGASEVSTPSTPSAQCFLNDGTTPITSLTVTTTAPPAVGGSPCTSDSYDFSGDTLFSHVDCTFNSQTNVLAVTFSGVGQFPGQTFPGVPVGTDFFMDLAGWNPNESFTGTANVTSPEPGSLALLALGLGAMFFLGRRKFANNSNVA